MGCWLSGPWSDQTVSGRSLTHLSQREAMQILAAAQHPITMQIKSQRRGQKADHASSWEPLPLGLQHLNLPRSFYSQLPVPQDHCDPRFGYLSSSPRDTLDVSLQDPEMAQRPKDQSCLNCCGSNMDEPAGFSSQPDDDDFLLDKPVGYLPLHHELDSGLGWTDGSVHQGELSGLETEEGGVDECLPHTGLTPGGCTALGGSPSSESFISSELSDSGFYSVSTGEFRHFQRLLEKRMRLYNARLQMQNEACERRERRDSCPKSHLLEAIPESLPIHRPNPDSLPLHRQGPEVHRPSPESLPVQQPCPQHGLEPDLDLPQRGLFRVSSVQFHKTDRPSLNRHSSSSGALFNPAHSVMSRLNAPVLSTCSTPSSHRRPLMSLHAPQPAPNPPQQLRRSRTLHYRPPNPEYRRRASHPASPSYYTLHQCPTAAAILEQQQQQQVMHNNNNMAAHMSYCDANANYEQYWQERSEHSRSIPENLVMEREQHILKQKEIEREQEHQRIIEMEREIEQQRLSHELEQKRINQIEMEQKRINHEMEQKRINHEMEQKRINQIEMEQKRLNHELEQKRLNHEMEQKRMNQIEMEQKRLNHIELEQKLELEQKRLKQLEQLEREKEHKRQMDMELEQKRLKDEQEAKVRESLEFNRRRFREHNSSFSQSGEANDTWPKPASRNLQNGAGSRGMYSTLDGPTGSAAATTAASAWDIKKAQMMNTSPNARLNQSVRQSRVSRSQLLRDRASQLADERSGMSTDDETNTDVLMGRYWSRTERKEHFLLARELRQQRGERSSSRERERAGNSTPGEADVRGNTVLELSHRKLSRLRNRKLLDDWTTVEELLTHGSRLDASEDPLTCAGSLLTVTTV